LAQWGKSNRIFLATGEEWGYNWQRGKKLLLSSPIACASIQNVKVHVLPIKLAVSGDLHAEVQVDSSISSISIRFNANKLHFCMQTVKTRQKSANNMHFCM
jgi:hypothetical protein